MNKQNLSRLSSPIDPSLLYTFSIHPVPLLSHPPSLLFHSLTHTGSLWSLISFPLVLTHITHTRTLPSLRPPCHNLVSLTFLLLSPRLSSSHLLTLPSLSSTLFSRSSHSLFSALTVLTLHFLLFDLYPCGLSSSLHRFLSPLSSTQAAFDLPSISFFSLISLHAAHNLFFS